MAVQVDVQAATVVVADLLPGLADVSMEFPPERLGVGVVLGALEDVPVAIHLGAVHPADDDVRVPTIAVEGSRADSSG